MSIPIRDPMSGSPAGGLPHITSWTSVRSRERRPKWVIVVPMGEVPQASHVSLWESERKFLGYRVDMYRALRVLDDRHPKAQVFSLPWSPIRVSASELAEAIASTWPDEGHPPADVAMRHARALRGEPVEPEIGRLSAAPFPLDRAKADDAAIAYVRTDHLYRGVRKSQDRWQGYVGLGGMLRIVCTCDTREEALTIATAHLWESWVTRVREIRELRGGDLSWGWEIPSPVLADEDPQASY